MEKSMVIEEYGGTATLKERGVEEGREMLWSTKPATTGTDEVIAGLTQQKMGREGGREGGREA